MDPRSPLAGNQTDRPTSVTVVSILLIVLGSFGLFSAFQSIWNANDPQNAEIMERAAEVSALPMAAQFAMSLIGSSITLAAGMASLNGVGWGRWAYFGWILLATLINLVTAPSYFIMAIPGVVLLAVVSSFLFCPAANAYFQRRQTIDASSV